MNKFRSDVELSYANLVCGYLIQKQPIPTCTGEKHTFAKGTLTAIMGPNGSGKTTLLKTLSGQLSPLSGTISLDQHPLKERAKTLSIVLSNRPQTGYLTVKEVATLGNTATQNFTQYLTGRLTPQQNEKIETALEKTQLEPLQNRFATTLSDGEFRRLMIARAMVQDTPIILLDEPLAFLDPAHKANILYILKNWAREGKTVIFSTHEPGFSLKVAESLLLIHRDKKITTHSLAQQIPTHEIETLFSSPFLQFDHKNFDLTLKMVCKKVDSSI